MGDMKPSDRAYEPPGLRWNPKLPDGIQDLPKVERPREKLVSRGPKALSDLELLAVLLGSGTRGQGVLRLATRILRQFSGRLHVASVESLQSIKGLGRAKACQISAAMELGGRCLSAAKVTVKQASDILPYLGEIRGKRQEHFLCISLTGANEVIQARVVTVGLLDSSQVHPREVFADPLTDRAAAVILAHNHPSGTLRASEEDLALTERLVKAGEILGLRVLDHLIVTRDGYLSLKEAGAML
jgi:DNA repair protein RadC